MNNREILGKKLQALRKSKKLSQTKLAQFLGISPGAVNQWERGITSPDTNNLKAIANYFNVTLDSLLSDDSEILTPSGSIESKSIIRPILYVSESCEIKRISPELYSLMQKLSKLKREHLKALGQIIDSMSTKDS